jgi:flavin reductase (DIM6/NTAB) family NADH-FMN oxidoreductase RutF
MEFVSYGPKTWLPQATTLVGTYDNEGKPNFTTASWVGIANASPPEICVSIRPSRAAHPAILSRKAFTILFSSKIKEMDFCGMTTGKNVDKAKIMDWHVRKSDKVDAPYADETEMVFECSLKTLTELESHFQFIGIVENVRVRNDCIVNKIPDILKICPFIYDAMSGNYFALNNQPAAKAFSVGRELCEKVPK